MRGATLDRQFLLPTLSGLALCVTACSSDNRLIGEWQVTTYEYDGAVTRLPYSYTDVTDGVTYSYTSGMLLIVENDGKATSGYYYEYTSSEGAFEREEYLYSGSWEANGRTFTFEIEGYELKMDCTLEGEELACEGEHFDEGVLITFVPFEDSAEE